MLSQLETLHQPTMRAKKPRKIKPVKGLKWARLVDQPQFAQTTRTPKGVKGKGVRYERQVQEKLEQNIPDSWVGVCGPWFQFEDSNGVRFAQADWIGFNVDELYICIAEMKLSRVPEAWWQLNRVYKPLVQEVFGWDTALVEITANLRHLVLPEDVKLSHDIKAVKPGGTYVMRLPYGAE